ncbi:MAG: alpha-2-macroglobulin family protein [Agriterribacter sp.]
MNSYDSAWKKIDELINKKGLTKTAASEIDKIYARAKKEKNDPQLMKALIFKLSPSYFNSSVPPPPPPDDNTEIAQIKIIENEIASASEPTKQIFQSLSAEMYWHYFQSNRWKFYNRTNTVNYNKEDIATWTADDLHKKISELYTASLQNPKMLQQTKLEKYEPIITKGNTRKLRPMLYDLLAHRALDYFENDEREVNKPAYAFTINENAAFDPVADFIHHRFITKDTAALQYHALLVYQQLLGFHINDIESYALIDADLRRLQFVRNVAVMPDKDEVYRMNLQHIISQYAQTPAVSQAHYLMAQYYNEKGETFESSNGANTADRNALKTAKQICDNTIKDFPKTEGAANCQNLLTSILRKSLEMTTEKINLPNEAFRTLVKYKNVSALNLRVIKVDKNFNEEGDGIYEDKYWTKLTAMPAVKQWKQDLPVTDDYLPHSVEIKIDALPVGKYMLLSSMGNNFSIDKNLMAVQFFYVSAISYVNSENNYFALHRSTGKPLAGAKVQVWTSAYDYTDRKNKLRKDELLTVDKNGAFNLNNNNKQGRNVQLEINWEKDYLFTADAQYNYNRYNSLEEDNDTEYEKNNSQVYFFTDRSIYRPGQTVYFKGIGITRNKETGKPVIITGKKVEVYLKDLNGQKIDSLLLTSNEYGSIKGQFRLPQQVLTGVFTIGVKDYTQSFTAISVEEYKRPKFSVEIEKPKQSFRVNDTVSITGTAKAYAGNSIDGAAVKYRVTRVARFNYPWLYSKRGMPDVSSMEITNGTAITDAAGVFNIKFNAIPDLSVDKVLDPIFDYSVEVDVTDINGETRSATSVIPVGYKSLVLELNVPDTPIPVDSFTTLSLSSKNLSGEWQDAKATVSITPLIAPSRLIRSRFWEKPDQFIFSEAEYIKLFPHDEYRDESDHHNWSKGKIAYTDTFTTAANRQSAISHQQFLPGWYVIEAFAKDKDGGDVKTIAYVQLYDPKSKNIPAPAYEWQAVVKDNVQPGETANIISGTAANDLYVIQEMDKTKPGQPRPLSSTRGAQAPLKTYSFITINNEKKQFDFPVTEDDRGGFGVTQFFVKDNRFYVYSNTIAVPWTNKELSVQFTTFRDKVQPGSQEKWQVKIGGNKSEKVAAEMLASMYDASLDQFRPHGWYTPGIWPNYYSYQNWQAAQSFTDVSSNERNTIPEEYKAYEKNYDRLIGVIFEIEKVMSAGILAAPRMARDERVFDGFSGRRAGAPAESGVYLNMQHDMNPDVSFKFTTNKGYKNKAVMGDFNADGVDDKMDAEQPGKAVSPRKNFNETAFFFPDLQTDTDGNISFSFTMPEALTEWKLMTFAHTKELAMGMAQQLVVTQKELMVQPNAPRFVREKDSMLFSAKVVNMSDKAINGFAKLELFDAATNEPVDHIFSNAVASKTFSVEKGQSVPVQFQLSVPPQFNAPLRYRIVASSNSQEFSDGEENILPVLTNQMLITEALPLNMRTSGTKKFSFEKLLKSGASTTQKNYGLTVEYTANPAWYAVQSLPYLTEYPYECAEQTFNRYYANILAGTIANSNPKIKAVFEKWSKDSSGKSLQSVLEKNEELKSVLLQETPWLVQAKSESEQKKNIAFLFDMVRMNAASKSSFDKLKDMQTSNGGFVWFKGGTDDRYITQYILTGIGHLQKLKAVNSQQAEEWKSIIDEALDYCDKRISEEYAALIKSKANLKSDQLTNFAVQYLYMRSFFPNKKVNTKSITAYNFYQQQTKKGWLKQSKYMQGMIALSLFRSGDKITPQAILASLKENAVMHDELGMYWKENRGGYYWYEAPVETQSLLIEAFNEITNDSKAVNDMKLWLLKQKQTQHWGNTKATAEACYALLLQGANWLSEESNVQVALGSTTISSDGNAEEGTGYFKKSIPAAEVQPSMGNIQVTVSPAVNAPKEQSGSWGAVYWQYFEDLDKITAPAGTTMPLQLKKQLFIEKNTDRGPVLEPLTDKTPLKVGDKLKVRIELRADRNMEYVHMKDLRAAGTEPVNVLSSYKWQGGLGYYESTKDASTNFFFNWLNKGTYVFEYPLFVTHQGNFSAGVATIQCMYAPEFVSHSEGVRIVVQ